MCCVCVCFFPSTTFGCSTYDIDPLLSCLWPDLFLLLLIFVSTVDKDREYHVIDLTTVRESFFSRKNLLLLHYKSSRNLANASRPSSLTLSPVCANNASMSFLTGSTTSAWCAASRSTTSFAFKARNFSFHASSCCFMYRSSSNFSYSIHCIYIYFRKKYSSLNRFDRSWIAKSRYMMLPREENLEL